MSGTTAAGLSVTDAALTIRDDDIASTGVALALQPDTVTEGGGAQSVTVTATLDAGTRAQATTVTVTVGSGGDSAVSGTDYDPVSSLRVTIDAASTSGTGSFSITPTNDTTSEGTETVTVSGTTTAGLSVTGATLTLEDDEALPAVTLSAAPARVDEGGTSAVTAALTGASSAAVEVTVSAPGSAAAAALADYAAPTGLELTIAASAARGAATFTITPTADGTSEGGEVLSLLAGRPVPGCRERCWGWRTATVRVPGRGCRVWPAVVREGAGATTVTVRAELDGTALSTPRVLTVSVGGGTAGSGDYDAVADFALTIAAQQTRGAGTFTLTPTADTVAEGIETLSVVARGSCRRRGRCWRSRTTTGRCRRCGCRCGRGGAGGRGRDGGDGAGGRGRHAGGAARVVRVALSPVAPVGYALGAARVLTIDAGETASGNTVTLASTADVYDTPDGLATLAGAASGGHGVTAPVPRLVTLADDDTASTRVALSVSQPSVAEDAGAVTLTVTGTLDGAARPRATTVSVTVGDGTARAPGTSRRRWSRR